MLSHLRSFFTHKKSLSVGSGFFVLGFLFGNWATLIPFIKSSYQINDSVLGMLLLCLPLGAMSFNPFAAQLVRKYSMQKMTFFGIILSSLAFFFPFIVPTFYLLPLALILVGTCMTLLNISVNTSATMLEKVENVTIMSTCHGMYSLGLMAGSLMRSFTLMANVNEITHMAIMCFLTLILGFVVRKTILTLPSFQKSDAATSGNFKINFPRGPILTIIIISMCINVTEGSMTDWASLYMKEIVKTSPYFIGWGLFGYSAFMAIGRFFGDGIIPVYGRNKVLVYGATLASTGLILTIVLPNTWTAILGFSLIGLGVSCGAPILYASASRYPDLPEAGGLALMNTYAMGGFLLGPVCIGFISDLTSLPMAFGCVALLTLIWLYKSINAILF